MGETQYSLTLSDIQKLIEHLKADGYTVIAPRLENGVFILDEIKDLVLGYRDRQSPGKYETVYENDDTLFSYTVPMQNWRRYLNPPEETLFTARINGEKISLSESPEETSKLAFFGIRGCDLKALEIQDKIFTKGDYPDSYYQKRRENLFIISADCPHPANTCFCTTFNCGPEAGGDYDIALSEIEAGNVLARSGSSRAMTYLGHFPTASDSLVDRKAQVMQNARNSIRQPLDVAKISKMLQKSPDHVNWEKIAERCLTCTNCTMSCPTCFCTNIDETPSLDGKSAARIRRWDSCFNISHSYIHGGHVRVSVASRYRQWLTHKWVYWKDQFDYSGCTGCGRCITWCPASIDFTEEFPKFEKPENGNGN